MKELPDEIRTLFKEHHLGSPSCKRCQRPCCAFSGFATLENVRNIYQKYVAGQLVRDDYKFASGLDYRSFTLSYFDVVYHGSSELVMFFPRHLSWTDHVVAFPETGDYWNARNRFFEQHSLLRAGCVFLKQKTEAISPMHDPICILHEPGLDETLSAKPIDCVFLTCSPGQTVKKDDRVEGEYFRLLIKHFGHEVSEWHELLGAMASPGTEGRTGP